ncbi:MAG: outer membrane protein transport protein [Bermanella sp.]
MKKLTLILFCFFYASNVFAQMAQSLLIDPKALSLGNAVTADPPGLASIHYNPAGLTKLEGRQLSVTLFNVILQTGAEYSLPDGYATDENGNEVDPGLLDFRDDPVVGQEGEAAPGLYAPKIGIVPLHLPVATLPGGGISVNPPGSKFTFATMSYMAMAGVLVKEDDDPGRYQGKQVGMQRLTYLSPSFGYKVNDEFSVGFGVLLSHQAFAISQDVRAVNILMAAGEMVQEAFGCEEGGGGSDPLVPFISMCGGRIGPYRDIGNLSMQLEKSMSFTYHMGVLWEPNDWFAWGASYQSEAKDELTGEFEFDYSRDFSGFFSGFRGSIFGAIVGAMFQLPTGVSKETGYVATEFTYPQHFQTGFKFRFMDKLQFNVDAGWTDYDEWESFKFEFDRQLDFLNAAKILAPTEVTATSLEQRLDYKSHWNFGFGLEYQLSSRLKARLGYEPRSSSIPDGQRNVMAPFGEANIYAVGFGYQWDLDTVVDVSLSFMKSEEEILASDPSGSLNTDCLTCVAANPYPGLDVKTYLSVAAAGITFRTKF